MKLTKVITQIRKHYPDHFRLGSGYLLKCKGLMLYGFCVEKTSTYINIYRFLYPLYDVADFFHLGFSEGAHNISSSIQLNDLPEELLIAKILEAVKWVEKTYSAIDSINTFIAYLNHKFSNTWPGYCLVAKGYSLILLKDYKYAAEILSAACDDLSGKTLQQCLNVQKVLEQEPNTAREIIINLAIERAEKLKLKHFNFDEQLL